MFFFLIRVMNRMYSRIEIIEISLKKTLIKWMNGNKYHKSMHLMIITIIGPKI